MSQTAPTIFRKHTRYDTKPFFIYFGNGGVMTHNPFCSCIT